MIMEVTYNATVINNQVYFPDLAYYNLLSVVMNGQRYYPVVTITESSHYTWTASEAKLNIGLYDSGATSDSVINGLITLIYKQ